METGNLNLPAPSYNGLSQEGLLEIAIRHRWVILSTVMLFLIGMFLYLWKATPIYTSTSRLYVEQTGPKIINEYEGLMTRSKNYLYTQSELIKSTPIIADVVENTQIKQFKTFDDVDNLVVRIKKALDVTVGKKDDIIAVSFDSPYPAEAAQLVNSVVESYIRYHSTHKRSTISEVLGILQKEKIKRDKELSNKFAETAEFTRTNGVISTDNTDGHIIFQRLATLSEALTKAQLARLSAKTDFEAIKSMADEPAQIGQFAAASATAGAHIFVNDERARLRSGLKDLEARLKSILRYCTEEHPSVKEIRARIAHIKQQLDEQSTEFADAYIEVMRLKWITAKQKEDELQASFDNQRIAAQELGIKAVDYSVLQSELKRLERLCEVLDDRIKELNVTEDVGALNISILEVARLANGPSKPRKAGLTAIALVLGLMFGFGLASLREWLDYRLRSPEEISAILGVPVLGVVPAMLEGRRTIMTQGQNVWLKLKPFFNKAHRTVLGVLLSGVSKGRKMTITTASHSSDDSRNIHKEKNIVNRGQKVRLERRSVVAEAYRTIRTAVFFGAPKDEAKTILVTSPAPGDGKSTLVSNLAITMAQAGQKTLVFDCDLRKPVQHKVFAINNEKGASSVLAGRDTIDEAIQTGPVEGLDILPCGPEVSNPSELLSSKTFAETLKNLSEQYDRIIIDSPPVGPVADSQILAAICDIVVLVLGAEKSTRRHSLQARDNLLSVGAHILGAVVNNVQCKHYRYRYGYHLGYGHYTGYGYYGNENREEQREYQEGVDVLCQS